MEKGFPALWPKGNRIWRLGLDRSGRSGSLFLVYSLPRTFSFYSHFPFPPFFHLDHPMQEGGNQAVCLSAWSSFWQIKRAASLSRKAFLIVVICSGWILVENIRLATNNLILWGWYLSASNFIFYRLEVCETDKIHLGSSWNIVHIHRIYQIDDFMLLLGSFSLFSWEQADHNSLAPHQS